MGQFASFTLQPAFGYEGGPSHLRSGGCSCAQPVIGTLVEVPVFGQMGHALVAKLVFSVKCRGHDACTGKGNTTGGTCKEREHSHRP